MSNITPPKAPVPIGLLTINGQQFEVRQHPEFVRFFYDLFRRVGGTDALNNTDLETLILSLDDAAGRLDAVNGAVAQLRDAISALQAGEMVIQSAQADTQFPDVMQAGSIDVFAAEMTCQI